MICNKQREHWSQASSGPICPQCLQDKLNTIEKLLLTLSKQVNVIEEQVVPKIED